MPTQELSQFFRKWVRRVGRPHVRPQSKGAKLRLQECEARLAPATLPQPTVTTPAVAFNNTGGITHSLQVVADPTNNTRQVAVGVSGNGLVGLSSTNSGTTWTEFYNTTAVGTRFRDPTQSENGGVSETTRLDAVTPSVAFDRNGMVYIVHAERASGPAISGSGVGSGVIAFDAFSFTGATPTQTVSKQELYRWGPTDDAGFNPTVAVDNNTKFVDPTSGLIRDDLTAGKAVYVAWNTNGTAVGNPNVVWIAGSSNMGTTFTTPVRASGGYGAGGGNTAAAPQILFSQSPLQVAGVSQPADLNIFWSEATAGNIFLDRTTPTLLGTNKIPLLGVTFQGQTGTIQNAGAADQQKTTNFTLDASTLDDNTALLNSTDRVTDLNVRIAIRHDNRDQLRVRLTSPAAAGSRQVTLFTNRILNDGSTAANGAGIPGGVDVGRQNGGDFGTTFDDQAARVINDGNNDAPFVGYFQAESGSLSTLFSSNTIAELAGTWTLEVFDSRGDTNPVTQSLNSFDLQFTFGLPDGMGANTNVLAGSVARGFADVLGPTSTVSPATGIGGYSVAIDNSTFAQSVTGTPLFGNAGTMYVAYTAGNDIKLASIAPGSTTAGTGVRVNDDGLGDFFTENRGLQFNPTVAVDSATGTVAVTWFDSRYDASNARSANYIATSIDGGKTFSNQTSQYLNADANLSTSTAQQPYFNAPKTARDPVSGSVVAIEPIPNNYSDAASFPNGGGKTSLLFANGKLNAYWAGNQNAQTGTPLRAVAVVAAGPRVIDNEPNNTSDQGALNGTSVTLTSNVGNTNGGSFVYNGVLTNGTPRLDHFKVVFDRPVDPTTFTAADVVLTRTEPNGTTTILPTGAPFAVDATSTIFLVPLITPQSTVGTYTYVIGPTVADFSRPTGTITPLAALPEFPSTDTPKPLPDSLGGLPSVVTSSIVVPAVPGVVIADLNVRVNITHTFVGDLRLTLVSPTGVRFLLSNRRGGGGDNFTNTVFDDQAGLAITAGSAPFAGSFRPEGNLNLLRNLSIGGTWTLEIGDYAGMDSGILNSWGLTFTPGNTTLTPNATLGNAMDQDADGTRNEATQDTFAIPRVNGAVIDRLPLSIPGPFFVSAATPGGTTTGTGDTLFLNRGATAIDLTFDRDMDPASFTTAAILRMTGPYGPVAGPFTVTNISPRVFRVGFPAQVVDGPYSIEFAPSTIRSANLDGLDTNRNAAINVTLGGDPITGNISTNLYNSTTSVPIAANSTVTLPLTVTDNLQIVQNLNRFPDARIQVRLDISHGNVPDLEAALIAPDGTRIQLFTNVGTVGQPPRSNFSNTTFDDGGATPIQFGVAPFNIGTFTPQLPLAALLGKFPLGQWQIEVTNSGSVAGSFNNWSLTLPFASPGTGLSEVIADRFQVGFRLFTQDPTNSVTQQQWTPVGPAGANNGSNTGQTTAVAVDPSDPSGNTVYVGGASGGIWKTTNFLTTDTNGPNWVPLTDFGPTNAINIGGLAIFPRNNDPSQSIIFALTGEGDSNTPGVGLLRSVDGGRTWKVLDSTVNTDASGNVLPINSPLRDHRFVGSTGFKVIVDPNLTPTGEVIVYMAISGTNGGLYRSINTGRSWTLMKSGDATDVVLAAGSIPRSGQSRNAEILYAAFEGDGVYLATQAPAATSMTLMNGGQGNPLIRDINVTGGDVEVTVSNGGENPNGGGGRMTLAAPALSDSPLENSFYQGWLYVFRADGSLFQTKDFGRNWTRVRYPLFPIPNSPNGVPTNDESRGNHSVYNTDLPVTSNGQTRGEFNQALAVNPLNPNIIYIGGAGSAGTRTPAGGTIRLDVTTISDPQAFVAYDHSDPGAGTGLASTKVQTNTGGIVPRRDANGNPLTPQVVGYGAGQNFVNLSRDPDNPFVTNTTIQVKNAVNFVNDGADIKWVPFNDILTPFDSSDDKTLPTADNVHRIISYIDPLTRQARFIFTSDHAITTSVDIGNGTINRAGVGFTDYGTVGRNGNLQLMQFYSGAVQPSTLAADIARSMFYGGAQSNGTPMSSSDILRTGNLNWTGPTGTTTGTATDQTGSGDAYHYRQSGAYGYFNPLFVSYLSTDFFRVMFPPSDTFNGGVSRTTGLFQNGGTAQWPSLNTNIGYFAVNPIDRNGALIGSNNSQVFRSTTLADPAVGPNWFPVNGTLNQTGGLQTSVSKALAFGAPDPSNPGQVNNFLYAGNELGNIFVTITGGAPWANISAGLHPGTMTGPAVRDIEANPRRGSRDAFAVTTDGVFYNPDTSYDPVTLNTTSTWQNITGNLFSLQRSIFGDPTEQGASLQTLTGSKLELTSLAVDWRYAIPDDPSNPTGPTHPVLYVAGEGGIFRSRDKGQTWTYFPNVAEDGATVDGGYLPNVPITDLDLSLGNIDPVTGVPDQGEGGLNMLVATTYGRGQFAIRLNTTLDQQFNVQFESGPVVTRLANPNAVGGPSTQLRVVFDQSVDPVTVGVEDFTLLDTTGAPIPISNVQLVSLAPPGGSNPFNEFLITFPAQATPGFYSLTVGPTLSDFAGNLMNQNGNSLNGEATEDAFQRFVFLNGLANSLIVDGLPSKVVAGNSANFTVSVQDENGFNITGFTGMVAFTSSDLGAMTMLPTTYNFTAADMGSKSFTVTFTTAGPQTITATAVTPGIVNPGRDGLTVLSAPASQLIVSGHAPMTVAGTDNTFMVMAKDKFGNLAADYTGTVDISSSDKQAVLPTQYKFLATDLGTKTFTAQLRTAGTQSISATDNVTVTLTGTQSGIVVTPAAPAMLAILNLPNPYNAGDFKTITVQSQDKFMNLSPGYTGTVTFSSSDPFAKLPADYQFKVSDNGSKDFTVQLRIPGSQTVTVADTASTLKSGTATTLVTPAAVASFKVQSFPSPVEAGMTKQFTVTAIAPDGSTAVGYLGEVTFTSTDLQAGLPVNYTFTVADNGVRTFDATLKTVGSKAITATEVGSSITGTQSGIVVTPAAASSFRVTSFPSPITAGAQGSFTVTALDPFQNTATGYTGTVTFTSTDAQASLPLDATLKSGIGTFNATLRTANTQAITATDTTTPSITGSQSSIVVNPAAASRYDLKGHPSPVNAGNSSQFTLTARDPFNNVATGYLGIVTFTSSDKQASLPTDYQFKASDKGVVVFDDILRTSGLQSITGTDTANSSITGQQTGISVIAGAAVGITVEGFPSPTTAGVPQLFTVTARDQFQNPAPTYTGTVRLTSTDNKAGLPADYKFTPGDAGTKTFTGTLRVAGSQSITAQDINTPAFNSTQSGITVVAAAGTKLVLSSLPLSVMAGSNQQLLATVLDDFNNKATGYTGTLAFTSSDAQAILPDDYQFQSSDKGQKLFTVSLLTAGSQDIAVNDTATATIGAGQSGIQVFAAAAAKFDVTGLPTSVLAGDPATFTVTARDAFNNLVTNYTGIVTFTSSDARAQLPTNVAFAPSDNGVRTFTARFGNPNVTSSVTVSQVGNGAVFGTASTNVLPNFDKDAALVGNEQFAVGTEARSGFPVRYFDSKGNFLFDTFPFQSGDVNGGGRVATADFTGDGRAEVIAGSSPGMRTEITVIDGFTEKQIFSTQPFEASFTGGIYITGGDITGDGIPEMIVSPDEGGGPRVRVFDGANLNNIVVDFFGIDDPNFRGGARTAVGDINGDGFGDLLVAAGFGGGPRVASYDGKSLAAGKFVKMFDDFFAFEQGLRNGVFIAAGDINGDGKAEMIVGGGPGGGPRVQAFDGASLLVNQQNPIVNFFAGPLNNRGGIRIAVKDLDGDNQADLITGSGTDAGSRLTAYYGKNLLGTSTPPVGFEFDTFPGFSGGVFVG